MLSYFLLIIVSLALVLVSPSGCEKIKEANVIGVNLTVDGKEFPVDTSFAVYADSQKVMGIFALAQGRQFTVIFDFDTSYSSKTYSATKVPFEVIAIYADSTGLYSTAEFDTTYKPVQPVGSGTLELKSHTRKLQQINGTFSFTVVGVSGRAKAEGDRKTLKGSFNLIYLVFHELPTTFPTRKFLLSQN